MVKIESVTAEIFLIWTNVPRINVDSTNIMSMVTQVKRMGSALARNRGEDESDVIRHLSQRVAVVLAKLNASMLLNRAPRNTPTSIDGVE